MTPPTIVLLQAIIAGSALMWLLSIPLSMRASKVIWKVIAQSTFIGSLTMAFSLVLYDEGYIVCAILIYLLVVLGRDEPTYLEEFFFGLGSLLMFITP